MAKRDKTTRLLGSLKSRPEKKTPIATDMFLPNQSGDHSAGNIRTTPSADTDIPNKKYVDDNKGNTTAQVLAAIALLTSIVIAGFMLSEDTDGFLLINASTRINGSLDVKDDISANSISASMHCGNLTGNTSDLCTLVDTNTNTQLSEAQVNAMVFDLDNIGDMKTVGYIHAADELPQVPTESGCYIGNLSGLGYLKLVGGSGGIIDFGYANDEYRGRIHYANSDHRMRFYLNQTNEFLTAALTPTYPAVSFPGDMHIGHYSGNDNDYLYMGGAADHLMWNYTDELFQFSKNVSAPAFEVGGGLITWNGSHTIFS